MNRLSLYKENRGYYFQKHGIMWIDLFDDDKLRQNYFEYNKKEKPSTAESIYYNLPVGHEYYHYLQSISTTYFLFANELSWLKTFSLRSLLRKIEEENKLKLLNPPIIDDIPQKKFFNNSEVEDMFLNLLGICDFESIILGGRVDYSRPAFVNAVASYAVLTTKNVGGVFDFKNLSARSKFTIDLGFKYTVEDLDPSNVHFRLSEGYVIKTIDIIESAATIASLFTILEHVKYMNSAIKLLKEYYPESYINLFEDTYKKLFESDVRSFCITFLCICDLALNPPIYWEHALIKENKLQLNEIIPGLRFEKILACVKEKGYLTKLSLYRKYCDEITSELNWVSSRSINIQGTKLLHYNENNWMKEKYVEIQKVLTEEPYLLAIPGIKLYDGSLMKMKKIGPPPWFFSRKKLQSNAKYVGIDMISKSIHWFYVNAMHEFMLLDNGFHWKYYFENKTILKAADEMTKSYLRDWYKWNKVPYF